MASAARREPAPEPGDLERVLRFASRPEDARIDPTIHERMRLGILSALAVRDGLDFGELKALLHATDGNLSVHARKLEEAGYLSCRKTFRGRTPRTRFRITAPGRRALARYLDHMAALIEVIREDDGGRTPSARS